MTLATVGSAATITFLVLRDRRRRRRTQQVLDLSMEDDPVEAVDVNEPADCVQIWLDDEWDRKFGRGMSDSSGSVEE